MSTEEPRKNGRPRRIRRAQEPDAVGAAQAPDIISHEADLRVQREIFDDVFTASGCPKNSQPPSTAVPEDVYNAVAVKTVAALCPLVKCMGNGQEAASEATRFAMKMNYMGFRTEIVEGTRVCLRVGVGMRPPIVPPMLTSLNRLLVKASAVLVITSMSPFVSEKPIDSVEIQELIKETGCSVAVAPGGHGTEVTLLRRADANPKRKRRI